MLKKKKSSQLLVFIKLKREPIWFPFFMVFYRCFNSELIPSILLKVFALGLKTNVNKVYLNLRIGIADLE